MINDGDSYQSKREMSCTILIESPTIRKSPANKLKNAPMTYKSTQQHTVATRWESTAKNERERESENVQ
jgi:hypothetical protein